MINALKYERLELHVDDSYMPVKGAVWFGNLSKELPQ